MTSRIFFSYWQRAQFVCQQRRSSFCILPLSILTSSFPNMNLKGYIGHALQKTNKIPHTSIRILQLLHSIANSFQRVQSLRLVVARPASILSLQSTILSNLRSYHLSPTILRTQSIHQLSRMGAMCLTNHKPTFAASASFHIPSSGNSSLCSVS